MSTGKEMPRIIAICSGKGGVGKSFLSIHLAEYAAAKDQRVLLLDADLGLANIHVMLEISSRGSVLEMVRGEKSLTDLIVSYDAGFDVLPGGSGFCELAALDSAQQQVMMDEMRHAVSEYDLVLMDVATGIGDNVLYFVSASESALVVLTPDPSSLTDAYALIKILSHQRDTRRFMVLVNQAEATEAHTIFKRLLSVTDRYLDVNLDYVGNLPYSRDISSAVYSQNILSEKTAPEIRQHLDIVFSNVLARPRDLARNGGLQFFWEHSLKEGLSVDYNPTSKHD